MDKNQTESTHASLQSKYALIGNIKTFHPLTFAGVGLILVFITCCFIPQLLFRWWLKVPIAIGSAILLFKRKKEASSLEKQICIYGIWAIIAAFIIRDIIISHDIISLLDSLKNMFQLKK